MRLICQTAVSVTLHELWLGYYCPHSHGISALSCLTPSAQCYHWLCPHYCRNTATFVGITAI